MTDNDNGFTDAENDAIGRATCAAVEKALDTWDLGVEALCMVCSELYEAGTPEHLRPNQDQQFDIIMDLMWDKLWPAAWHQEVERFKAGTRPTIESFPALRVVNSGSN